VRYGGASLVSAKDVAVRTEYQVQRVHPAPAFLQARRGHPADVFDLTRLPPGMQEVLALLLLLPVGALITAVFRTVVGVRTFGTFTPCLIALSFAFADWRTGLVVFAVVMVGGLSGRKVLEGLKLLMVPRLSLVLTLVVVLSALAVSVFDYCGWTPSARAVLLPVVILTMMIERFHISAEEDGTRSAVRRLAGTFGVALCCFAVLRLRGLGRLALTFPEGLLVLAAALIVLGRYSGYRLVELWRFRGLRGPGEGGS
jgi:hypothetical protein